MSENLIAFVIDDDSDDQEIVTMAVEEIIPPIVCVFANNGADAIHKFQNDLSFIPNFILLDINMPKMNGIECLTQIKKIERLLKVPVYMYSTSADPNVVTLCSSIGAAGYIKKNTCLDALKQNIADVVAQITSNLPT